MDIDETDVFELSGMFCKLFAGKMSPGRDGNGNVRKDIPFTKVRIVRYDKKDMRGCTVTHGNIYNLSPIQVKERVAKAIKNQTSN